MKRAIWSIRDLIDLEYFLHRDEGESGGGDQPGLADRDRGIYLHAISPLDRGKRPLPPGRIIRLWLDHRRKSEPGQGPGPKPPLPGEVYADVYRLMVYGFLAAGVLSGSGLAFSLLNYRGTEPLNVSVYLAALVLSQCLTLLFLAGIRVIRRVRRSPFHRSVLFTLASGVMARLILRMKEGALERLAASQRAGLEAVAGLVRGRHQVYGKVFYWPVFLLAQIFGIGFNLGALAGTLLKVIGSDVAFGWQSTIQFSARAVFRIVQVMALPWSWWVPEHVAHPSLSEIEGSHMVLKDGIYHLATQDLVSWWPFLCLSVLTYGLAPRVALLVTGLVLQRRDLAMVDLGHAACARLLQRLTTPIVKTQGRPVEAPGDDIKREDRTPDLINKAPADHGDAGCPHPVIALIPDDIFESCQPNQLEQAVVKAMGCAVAERIRVGEGVDQDEAVLRTLHGLRRGDRPMGLLLVQEAWQPPIRETLRFIQDLRSAAGDRTMFWVGLVGRPREGQVFTRPKAEDVQVWRQKLKALGDPYLWVERLADDEA